VVLEETSAPGSGEPQPWPASPGPGGCFPQADPLDAPKLEARNHLFHRLLVEGVTVEYPRPDGSIAGAQPHLLDFDDPDNNDWLAVNQFTVVRTRSYRRADIIIFVTACPVVFRASRMPQMRKSMSGLPSTSSRLKQPIASLFATMKSCHLRWN